MYILCIYIFYYIYIIKNHGCYSKGKIKVVEEKGLNQIKIFLYSMKIQHTEWEKNFDHYLF